MNIPSNRNPLMNLNHKALMDELWEIMPFVGKPGTELVTYKDKHKIVETGNVTYYIPETLNTDKSDWGMLNIVVKAIPRHGEKVIKTLSSYLPATKRFNINLYTDGSTNMFLNEDVISKQVELIHIVSNATEGTSDELSEMFKDMYFDVWREVLEIKESIEILYNTTWENILAYVQMKGMYADNIREMEVGEELELLAPDGCRYVFKAN